VSEPLDTDERWFAHLLASIPAPGSLETLPPPALPVAPPPRRRRSRVGPLAIAVAVAVMVGVVGAGLGLVLPRGRGNAPATVAPVVPAMPTGRSDAAMASDPAHRRALLFGGHGRVGLLGDTWSWDGHRWSREIVPSGPAPRASAAMAAGAGGVVLFGGAGPLGLLDDTWWWDGRTWSLQRPRISPPPSAAALMAEDPAAHRTLLVVPDASAASPVSTWSWDGHDWARRQAATAPPSCAAVMAADPATRRVVLVTGRSCPASLAGATWSWDGQSWTQLHPAASPPAHDHPALGAGGGHLLLFSPEPDPTRSCAARLTWTWDGATWSPHAPPVSPPAAGPATTDPNDGSLLLLTPAGETWRWTGSAWELGEAAASPQGALPPTPWVERAPAGCPPPRTGAAMVTDEARHQVLLFGGSASPLGQVPPVLGGTWVWEGSGWTQLHPDPEPPARTGAVMAYDAAHSVVVLFGGQGLDDRGAPAPFDATWTWNGSAWKRQAPKSAPPGLRNAAMAWDPGRHAVILVTGASTQMAQTWSWDGSAWIQLHPHTPPPFGALVTAPDLGGVLLVSPAAADHPASTWTWDGGDWHPLGIAGTPAPSGPAIGYEAAAHRVVLFGGDCPTGHCPGDATWTFDGHSWTQLRPATSPAPRSGAVMAPDPRGVLVLFGGTSFVALLGDTWEFS
jgi:hypothetical protein